MSSPTDEITQVGQPAGGCVMIIFGASGDLTKRKLIPAIYNLSRESLLREDFSIVGFARRPMSHDDFRRKMTEGLAQHATGPVDSRLWSRLAGKIYYLRGNFEEGSAYRDLQTLLSRIDREHGTGGNYFYYLATGPEYFAPVVQQLKAAGLTRQPEGRWRRIIIEKPYGHDLQSARSLNRELIQALEESQIYRIDHYLGKETVQNILVFRFSNGIFEPIWNRRYIDHVQITVAETLGVEQRGGYYDQAGALRDMVPNHIFQLISLTAMEPPVSFAADSVRDEQEKILRAVQPLGPEEIPTRTVRGQYGPGRTNGQSTLAYRSEPRVPPDSNTETYVALKLLIDNWRWSGVPFYLRTGKALLRRVTEIAIQFKQAPFILFRKTPVDRLMSNRLVLHLQPNEGISLRFGAKIPGPLLRLGAVDMDFRYRDTFGATSSTGYERLLYDCMVGDATLFQRADMAETGWSIVEPILDAWKAFPPSTFPNYAAGTWGPREAEELIRRDGRHWRNIEE